MRNFSLHFLLLLLIAFRSYAQEEPAETFVIKGKLEDGDKNPVLFANVALYSAKDSTLAGGIASDDKGAFEFPAAPGNYFLKITYLTLDEKIVPNVTVATQDLDLGIISLKSNSKVLE